MEKEANSSVTLEKVHNRALDSQNYVSALNLLDSKVRVMEPSDEVFGSSNEFVEMLKILEEKYEIKKVLSEKGNDCSLDDYKLPNSIVFMISRYQVENDRITFMRTKFDSNEMPRMNAKEK